MVFRKQKGKSHLIADRVRAEISSGRLRPGDRIQSVRELADMFSVSLKAAQVALDALAAEGLIDRRRGAGTFVKPRSGARDNTIYVLAPNASHLTMNHETSIMMRCILYGATRSTLPGQLVTLLPVSRSNTPSLTRNPAAIDWAALERIPAGAQVFVSGAWYERVIPFLMERGVRGIILSAQYDLECPETMKLIQGGVWPVITVDRRAAIRRVVEYLHASGKRRMAAVKRVSQQPLHPFRQGFAAGLELCHLPFDERSFHEYAPGFEPQWGSMIESLWREVKFDALILCSRELAATAGSVLAAQGLNIPEDVAVIAYRDLPGTSVFDAHLTMFDFPWVDIGDEMVRLFNENAPGSHETRFQAEIIERGSVRKDLASPAPRTRISEGSLNIPVMV